MTTVELCMTTFVIYHNPRCSKSRQTLALLQEHGIEPEIRLYLDNTPSPDEIMILLKQLKINARDLLRRSESTYKELNLSNIDLSDAELIEAMYQNPKLIERPIVVTGTRAVLGRPPENVLELLS